MRGQILPILAATVTAVGLSLSMLQSPVIPTGPAWAVAISLLGTIVILVIREVGKIRQQHTGERIGQRSSDDVKLDREQIRGEINLLAMTARTLETVKQLEETMSTMQNLLERVTVTMEAAQETQKINTGILETMIRQSMTIEERIQHMPTTAEFLKEGERNRHALRNDAHVLTLGGQLPPRQEER